MMTENAPDRPPFLAPAPERAAALAVDLSADAVRVGGSDGGQPIFAGPFNYPLTDREVGRLRWYLDRAAHLTDPTFGIRAHVVERFLTDVGARLALLTGGSLWPENPSESRLVASATARPVLVRANDPALLGLPWELMAPDRDRAPIGLARPILRCLDGTSPRVTALGQAGQPLRVLAIIARPFGARDGAYLPIADTLTLACRARGDAALTILRPATIGALEAALTGAEASGAPFDIIHYDGHGCLGPGADGAPAPHLVFESPDGGPTGLLAAALGARLTRHGATLVVLNAGHPGHAEPRHVQEAGAAMGLISAGVPAVVAAGAKIDPGSADRFAQGFYRALFQGAPVSEATRIGRIMVATTAEDAAEADRRPVQDWFAVQCYGSADPVLEEPSPTTTTRPTFAALPRPTAPMDAAMARIFSAFDAGRPVFLRGVEGDGARYILQQALAWRHRLGASDARCRIALYASETEPMALGGFVDAELNRLAPAQSSAPLAEPDRAVLIVDRSHRLVGRMPPEQARADIARIATRIARTPGARLVLAGACGSLAPDGAVVIDSPTLGLPEARALAGQAELAPSDEAALSALVDLAAGHKRTIAAFAPHIATWDAQSLDRLFSGMPWDDARALPKPFSESLARAEADLAGLEPWASIATLAFMGGHLPQALFVACHRAACAAIGPDAEAAAEHVREPLLASLEARGLLTRRDHEVLRLAPHLPRAIVTVDAKRSAGPMSRAAYDAFIRGAGLFAAEMASALQTHRAARAIEAIAMASRALSVALAGAVQTGRVETAGAIVAVLETYHKRLGHADLWDSFVGGTLPQLLSLAGHKDADPSAALCLVIGALPKRTAVLDRLAPDGQPLAVQRAWWDATGRRALADGDWDGADRAFRQALSLIDADPETGPEHTSARVKLHLALGDIGKARQSAFAAIGGYSSAARLADAPATAALRAEAMLRMGEWHLQQASVSDATAALEEAELLAAGLRDLPVQAQALAGLTRVALAKRDMLAARRLADRTFDRAGDLGDRGIIARTALALAKSELAEAWVLDALHIGQEALLAAKRCPLPTVEIEASATVASAALAVGDYHQAARLIIDGFGALEHLAGGLAVPADTDATQSDRSAPGTHAQPVPVARFVADLAEPLTRLVDTWADLQAVADTLDHVIAASPVASRQLDLPGLMGRVGHRAFGAEHYALAALSFELAARSSIPRSGGEALWLAHGVRARLMRGRVGKDEALDMARALKTLLPAIGSVAEPGFAAYYHLQLGDALFTAEQIEAAYASYRAGIERGGQATEREALGHVGACWHQVGTINQMLGRFEEAIAAFKTAIALKMEAQEADSDLRSTQIALDALADSPVSPSLAPPPTLPAVTDDSLIAIPALPAPVDTPPIQDDAAVLADIPHEPAPRQPMPSVLPALGARSAETSLADIRAAENLSALKAFIPKVRQSGRADLALAVFDRLCALVPEEERTAAFVLLASAIGNLCVNIGAEREALVILRTAYLVTLDQPDNAALLAHVANDYGWAFLKAGDGQGAREFFWRALSAAREADDFGLFIKPAGNLIEEIYGLAEMSDNLLSVICGLIEMLARHQAHAQAHVVRNNIAGFVAHYGRAPVDSMWVKLHGQPLPGRIWNQILAGR